MAQDRVIAFTAQTRVEGTEKLNDLKRVIQETEKELKDLRKATKDNVGAQKAAAGQFTALETRLKGAKSQYGGLQKEILKANKVIPQQSQFMKELTGSFRDALAQSGLFGRSMAIINQAVNTLKAPIKIFTQSVALQATTMTTATTATGRMSAALKLLRLALISTGIGAIVVALGSMVTFLTQTERGMEAVERATAGLRAVFSVIVDRISAFGEVIFNAFDDPVESLKSFGRAIVDNILNRFQAVLNIGGLIGKAFSDLFTGNFSKLGDIAEEAGKQLVQLTTGFDAEQQAKFGKAISDVTNEIKNETAAAVELERALQRLEDREIGLIVTQAKRQSQIEKLRLLAKDENLIFEDRLKALDQAIELERVIASDEIKLAKERARIAAEQIALGESTDEDIRRREELRADVIRAETERDKKIRTLAAERLTFLRKLGRDEAFNEQQRQKQREIDAKAAADRELKIRKELEDEKINLISDATEREIAKIQLEFDRKAATITGNSQAEIELLKTLEEIKNTEIQAVRDKFAAETQTKEKETFEKRLTAAQTFGNGLGDILGQAAEGQLKTAEDFKKAFANLLIDTLDATVNAAIARIFAESLASPESIATGGIGGLAKAAIISALLKGAVAGLRAAVNKGQFGGVVDETLAHGGMVHGRSHAQGGEKFRVGGRVLELEGGEAVINKRSTAMFKPILSRLNEAGGGKRFQFGGVTPGIQTQAFDPQGIAEMVSRTIAGEIGQLQVINTVVETTREQRNIENVQREAAF